MDDSNNAPQAAMTPLGEYLGKRWFWANERFVNPGLYYWDEVKKANIHVDLEKAGKEHE